MPHIESANAASEIGLEWTLAALWAEVLRLDRVGMRDNFFDLGGSSILIQTLRVKLEALIGRKVPITDLYEFPTVSALAAHLASS